MHQQALRSALDEFHAMKRARNLIDTTAQAIVVRDGWKAIITANYEIGEKLKLAFDKTVQTEKDYKEKFFTQQKTDALLSYAFYARKVGTHHYETTADVNSIYFELDGDAVLEYGNLPDPKPDFDSFLRQHPKARRTPVAVVLRRFKHMDRGRFMGWIGTPAEHLGLPIYTHIAGFTPSDAARYLVTYYEVVFSQLVAFPAT